MRSINVSGIETNNWAIAETTRVTDLLLANIAHQHTMTRCGVMCRYATPADNQEVSIKLY